MENKSDVNRTCLDENKIKEGSDKKPSLWSQVTLEPMWLGVTVSMTMGIIAFKNLFLERACLVDLGYSREICFHSEGAVKAAVEIETQKIVSSITVGAGFVGGLLTSAILIFLGPWSDSSGRRKPLVLLPLASMGMTSLSLFIIQFFPKVSTFWVVYAEVIPLAVGGNFSLLIMAGFSYLGDICFKTGRCPTTVMGYNSGALSLSMVLGSILAPYLLDFVGFTGVFAISFFLELTSFAYAYFMMKDVNIAEKIPNILDIKLPLEAVKCVFKKREGHRRRNILLMVIVPCCNSVVFLAELAIGYLYLRNQFGWGGLEYSHFMVLRSTLQVFGTIITVKVLKHRFKLEDQTIGLVGATSLLLSILAFLLSYKSWMLYASVIFGTLARAVMIAERPVLNKQIVANEQGKINCITSVLEKCTNFVTNPLINFIYSVTLEFYPGTYLIVCIVASVGIIVCYLAVKKEKEEIEMKNADDLVIVIPVDDI